MKQWKDANTVTKRKNKGDKSVGGNRRGIALLSLAGKVLARVVLHRLVNTITKSESDLRKNRSTVDMMFTWRRPS